MFGQAVAFLDRSRRVGWLDLALAAVLGAAIYGPSAGEVLCHGEPLRGLDPGIGFVLQSLALFPRMTVAQNVEAVLRARRLPSDEVEARARGDPVGRPGRLRGVVPAAALGRDDEAG